MPVSVSLAEPLRHNLIPCIRHHVAAAAAGMMHTTIQCFVQNDWRNSKVLSW